MVITISWINTKRVAVSRQPRASAIFGNSRPTSKASSATNCLQSWKFFFSKNNRLFALVADEALLVGLEFPNIADALGCRLTATLFVLIQEIVITINDGFSQKLVNCVVVSTAGIFA